ncbi:hypothetical protein [Hymenobacter perfusus]|uniref:Uncharacterized protein n=1 Tax=Hymenobacter perfusus TaxID=1236770 RepID=A0A3R9MP40_9BACT|nr:hypothetical protein [Hymenobacter perfusus]RSK46723.1 hypothetical protein EI293_06140 [Hymenobacter perfusus]
MDAGEKGRTFALPIRNADEAAANPRATSAHDLPCLPATWLGPLLSSETGVEKKDSHGGCESQQEVLTFAPRFNRRRFSSISLEKLFSVSLLEKGRKGCYLCTPLSNEKRVLRSGNEENGKNFFLPASWKKQQTVYLCSPLQPEAGSLKNESLSKLASKKVFQKSLRQSKSCLPLQPASTGRDHNTNNRLLSSGPR